MSAAATAQYHAFTPTPNSVYSASQAAAIPGRSTDFKAPSAACVSQYHPTTEPAADSAARRCESSAAPLGRAERDELVRDHLPMAVRLARKIARRVPRQIGRDELESAAMLGLTEAASRFVPRRGEPFPAFAAKRIRGAVLDELRRHDMLTRRGREGARRLADAARAVERRAGRPATTDELAGQLGVSIAEVSQLQVRVQNPAVVSLEELHNGPATAAGEAPDEQYIRCEQRQTLHRALRSLPERDLLVLSLYYLEGLTLKQIGEVLDVSESRVHQLRTRALDKMRRLIAH
ncbi:MAG: FliA/WhiG family RNA polymerase sigma factor [Myxococcota bacterium]